MDHVDGAWKYFVVNNKVQNIVKSTELSLKT
jgi:hypothetical protein